MTKPKPNIQQTFVASDQREPHYNFSDLELAVSSGLLNPFLYRAKLDLNPSLSAADKSQMVKGLFP